MLEKVTENVGENILIFRNILPNEVGTGMCFVRDGANKISKLSKPFVVLYLQDSTNAVVPGYVFDIDNFKASGIDLSKAIGSIVKISYEENFIPNFGMSLRLTSVELVSNPPAKLMTAFVGRVPDTEKKFEYIQQEIGKYLQTRVALPFTMCTTSHLDYSNSRAGGVLDHYAHMCEVLSAYVDIVGEDNAKQLMGTFLLYIHAHHTFLQADKMGTVDITLARKLEASVYKIMEKLELGPGAAEVCNIFFGYEPKDFFVRTVCQVSESIMRISKEKSLWDTLPYTREGNAGYGTIRRYNDTEGKT